MISKLQNKAKEWLLWSQKYTRTDMLYLAKGGLWLSLGDVISAVLGLLTAIAFANLLPQEIYGTYRYILSIAGVLSIASLNRMGTAVTRAVARGFEGSFVPAVKAQQLWSLLGSIGGLAVAGYYFTQDNNTLTVSFLIVALFIPLYRPFVTYSSYFSGKKLFNISTRYTIISHAISAIVLIVVLYLTNNILLILLGYFAPLSISSYTFYRITKSKIQPDSKVSEEALSFGKHLSFLGAITAAIEQLDKILLWHFLGAASLAIYAFALAPVHQMLGFIKLILPLSLPKLAEKTKGDLKKTLPYKLFIMAGTIGIFVLIYIIAAPLLFKILFPQYIESVFYSQIFALGLLTVPRNLISEALNAHGETKKIYILSLTSATFRLPLIIILVGLFGIWGAIYAYIISSFFSLILSAFLFFKRP